MGTYSQIIEGLQLLATCEPNGLATHGVQAEHDEIYAGPSIEKVSKEVSLRLEALGWHHSEADCWAIYT